ncbi:GNAT family N-acetyltransferase [Microbacterium sp. SLBN-146]|uniref:GNAT family N-acetyltransferase n=1 Tax=Microbacterium sp. SLBN-146 TaxID=2768457 RepID=UPI00114E5769|nr:GNAT family N-acetyltransferase [Microbacterium sp. SLBN-146]TQJ31628.1 putative acetyltransferase [Microbacterium sp. SLBN-146]
MSTELSVDVTAYREGTPDPVSAERLSAQGLEMRTIPAAGDDFEGFLQAVVRGFLGPEHSAVQVTATSERSAYRRATGVYDPQSPVRDRPVGTIASWMGRLSMPGDRDIPACAISAVTVAPTHRRRGIARALLEGELRAAHAARAPIAMLTVSESTLYGRYGFAPAAASAEWVIDIKRAAWTGPTPAGRVDFIAKERARELLSVVHERVRRSVPGEIDIPAGHWDTIAGTRPDAVKPEAKRAVQYADASGEVRGIAVYSVTENEADYTKSTVTLTYLLAETDEAYAALWRFFIEMDLIGELRASELSVDEPLLWMLSDQRAAVVTVRDHQYVRVLDVPATLEARTFGAPGSLVLDVSDPLDLAGGRFRLDVGDDLTARVERIDSDDATEGAVVALGIQELSAISLGGVSVATLAAAGRISTTDAALATRMFAGTRAPRLSIWY